MAIRSCTLADNAEQAGVALVVGADGAQDRLVGLDLRDVPAALTRTHRVAQPQQLFAQLAGDGLIGGDEEHGVAQGGLFPHAGQARKSLDDAADSFGQHDAAQHAWGTSGTRASRNGVPARGVHTQTPRAKQQLMRWPRERVVC